MFPDFRSYWGKIAILLRPAVRQLPLEIIEEIITEAWKDTSGAYERYELYSTLKEVHPTIGEIMDRVAIRYVVFASLGPERPSDGVLYTNMLRDIERKRRESVSQPGDYEPTGSAAQQFQRSHVRLDAEQMWYNREFDQFKLRGGALYPILAAVTSVTIGSVRMGERTGVPTEAVLRMLGALPALTHLHLDFDEDSYRYEPRAVFMEQRQPPIVLPTLAFLRTRTCPSCGLASSMYVGARDQVHAAECFKGAFGRAFPRLRELQLDAPLFLKYLDAPRTLERVTISAPPTMKLFCSIQGYNVATGLRRWLVPREDEFGVKGRRMQLKTVVVRTGKDEPIGWPQARDACEKFGVEFVREVFYH